MYKTKHIKQIIYGRKEERKEKTVQKTCRIPRQKNGEV